MKTLFTAVTVFISVLFFSKNSFAQCCEDNSKKNGYLGATASIGLPPPAQSNEIDSDYKQDSAGNISDKGIYGSLGAGPAFSVFGGHSVTKNIDAGISIGFFSGKKFSYTYDEYYGFGSDHSVTDFTQKSKGLIVEPYLAFKYTPEGSPFTLYTKTGLLLPSSVKKTKTSNETVTSQYYTETENKIEVFKSGLCMGASAGLGLSYKASDLFSIFGQLVYRSMSVWYKSSSLTNYNYTYTSTWNNESKSLVDLDVVDKETEYVKETSYNSNNIDKTKPSQQVRMAESYNSLMFSIGVRVNLNGVKNR